MTDTEIAELVKAMLIEVAPDLKGQVFDANLPFREQFEVDSMDMLNFIIALHKATGIDIPERDYAKLETLSGSVAYVRKKGFGQ
jgi:acyl carrier protein